MHDQGNENIWPGNLKLMPYKEHYDAPVRVLHGTKKKAMSYAW